MCSVIGFCRTSDWLAYGSARHDVREVTLGRRKHDEDDTYRDCSQVLSDSWHRTQLRVVRHRNKGKKMNQALTVNADGAQRNPDIHWPDGQHPEDADLFAHNEIVVHASCETVFANIADAETWPKWYPNAHNVKVHDSPDGKLHNGIKFSWDTLLISLMNWYNQKPFIGLIGAGQMYDVCAVPSAAGEPLELVWMRS
jgi:hypothetical protein